MGLKNVAHTPPKGWNSWDCYGASVREDEVIANAEYMAKHLKQHGWDYVIVDIQWYEPAASSSLYNAFYPLEVDGYSRLIPAVNRFPSSKNGQGFIPLGKRVHDLGLKFGIHIMRGIPRQAVHQNTPILGTDKRARDIAHPNSVCPWNTDMYGVDVTKEGAQEYYNSLFSMYASWGVDFVKVDDIAASKLYDTHIDEIKMLRKAIDNCGRDMVLSLSPGPAPLEYAEMFKQNANMWRMTDDFWDTWDYLLPMFERCAKWAEHVGSHNWPDCDMLPLGHIGIRSQDGGATDRHTRFTKPEQITMMTLWSIFRSPLMFGGDLCNNDDWTLSLLTNEALNHMHQTIINSREFSRTEDTIVWVAESADAKYTALFNISDNAKTVDLGVMSGTVEAFDIWAGKDVALGQSVNIEPHGAVLYRLKSAT